MKELRTRKFKYVDPDGDHYITEQEILEKYWNFWHTKIYTVDTANTRKLRDLPLSLQCDRCIEDFLVVHWAEEII